MKFDRWFWKDDTAAWSRRTGRFLLVVTVAVLLLLLGWLVWNR